VNSGKLSREQTEGVRMATAVTKSFEPIALNVYEVWLRVHVLGSTKSARHTAHDDDEPCKTMASKSSFKSL
jgi:hypothetical protein